MGNFAITLCFVPTMCWARTQTGEFQMSKKAIVMAFVALMATAAGPALAGDPATQDRPSDACKAQLRDSLFAPGAALKGIRHEWSSYRRWPTGIVVEASRECPRARAF